MSGNSFGPARALVHEDMRAFDELPIPVRDLLNDAPVNFRAGTILAVWRLHEFDGGTLRSFLPRLRRKMSASMRAAGIIWKPTRRMQAVFEVESSDPQRGGGALTVSHAERYRRALVQLGADPTTPDRGGDDGR